MSARRTIAAKEEEWEGLPSRREGMRSLGQKEESEIGSGKGSPCASESASATRPTALSRPLATRASALKALSTPRRRRQAGCSLSELGLPRRPLRIRLALKRPCLRAARARLGRTEVEMTRTTDSTPMQDSRLPDAESESKHEA